MRGRPDLLTNAEQLFASKKLKAVKAKVERQATELFTLRRECLLFRFRLISTDQLLNTSASSDAFRQT